MTALAAAEHGVEVVAHIETCTDLEAAVADLRADVLVTSRDDSGPAHSSRLLFSQPRLRVLTVLRGGRACQVERLVVMRSLLEDVSPEDLIDAILDADGGQPTASDS